MSKPRSPNRVRREVSLQVGQTFNPHGIFTGSWVPEPLMRAKGISPGAKLTYSRLARYAGQQGKCFPSVATLASEVGVSVRQIQNLLAELERNNLIRRVARHTARGQTSNDFKFIWHPIFEEAVQDTAPEGVKDIAPEGVQDSSPKESQIEESQIEESHNIDLDSPSSNRKKRDSRLDAIDGTTPRDYPGLREKLADYMHSKGDSERVYPSRRLVADVMDASGGATEDEVIRCLHYLREERGLRPGTRGGPRHFSWFKTVVADYFRQRRDREFVFAGHGQSTELEKGRFDEMTDAIELPGQEVGHGYAD